MRKLLVFAFAAGLAAMTTHCSGTITTTAPAPPASSTPLRAVTGQLAVQQFAGLDNPAVIAESSTDETFVTEVAPDGMFQLQLPSGASYRMTLANSTPDGTYASVAEIEWPLAEGDQRWAEVGAGDALDLGMVYLDGTNPPAASNGGVSTYGYQGSCHRDDHCHMHRCQGMHTCKCKHRMDSSSHCGPDQNASSDEDRCNAKNDHADGGIVDGGAGDGHDCMPTSGSGSHDGSHHHDGGVDASVPSIGEHCHCNQDCSQGMMCMFSMCVP